jgi:hypothetical protein
MTDSIDSYIENLFDTENNDKDVEKSDNIVDTEENNDTNGAVKKKDSIRKYWFEILLCILCVCFVYYIWSSIFNFSFMGIEVGRLFMQSLVFLLPFFGLWVFYKVNQSRHDREIGKSKDQTNLLVAMEQNGRCANCTKILDQDYHVTPLLKQGIKGKKFKALCKPCFELTCLNNSLYKTIKDF